MSPGLVIILHSSIHVGGHIPTQRMLFNFNSTYNHLDDFVRTIMLLILCGR